MAVTVESLPMARNDVQQKIDAEVAWRAKVVALKRGIPVAQYLTEILKPQVDRDYEEVQRNEGFVKADEKGKPKTKRGE